MWLGAANCSLICYAATNSVCVVYEYKFWISFPGLICSPSQRKMHEKTSKDSRVWLTISDWTMATVWHWRPLLLFSELWCHLHATLLSGTGDWYMYVHAQSILDRPATRLTRLLAHSSVYQLPVSIYWVTPSNTHLTIHKLVSTWSLDHNSI
jgi:hypothetical protein